MGADYSFYVKFIATFALTFFGYIISVLASVLYSGKPLEFALKSKMLSLDGWIVIGNEATLSLHGGGKDFQIECWVFKYIKNLKVKFRLFLRWNDSNKMNVRIVFIISKKLFFTLKRTLERLGIQTSSLFVKIWLICIPKFKTNFFFYAAFIWLGFLSKI